MKAPNGEPTNLTEEQWANVRTKAFKDWFGDWELAQKVINIISADKEHGFKNFADARNWAKENIVGLYHNSEIGEVNISGEAINKYLSQKAVEQSVDKDIHLSTLKVMPQVIKNSIVGEIHNDRSRNENIRDIVRLFGCVVIDNIPYRVKTTIKRYNDANIKTKAYSYEVTEIELLGGTLEAHTQSADSYTTPNNSITGANLLKGVENSKGEPILNSSKIVDENGEPMVVYHGTRGDINEFKDMHRDDGFYFVDRYDVAEGYAKSASNADSEKETIIPAFLNIRNPRIEDAYGETPMEFNLEYYVSNDDDIYEIFDNLADAKKFASTIPNSYVGTSEVGDQNDLVKLARKQGNDGVVMLNVYDQRGSDVDGTQTNYVAFEPNQIKSATDNVKFGEGDDIRYSLRSGVGSTESALDAMKDDNSKGWQSIKDKLRGTPIWEEVAKDINYTDEDAIAKEALYRLKVGIDDLTQEMTDNAKGVFEKAEAVAMADRMRRALNEFDAWVEQQVAEPTEGEDVKYSLRLSTSNASIKRYDKANGTDVKGFFDYIKNNKVAEKGQPKAFHIANAGELLEKYGIKGKFMAGDFTFSRTHTQNEDHELGINEWVDVINNLNNPLAIASYKGLPNRYRIYTYATINGKNICVGVDVSTSQGEIKLSRILSAYGRDVANLLGKEKVNLIYPTFEELKKRIQPGSTEHNPLLLGESSSSADKGKKNLGEKQEEEAKYSLRVGGVLHPQGDDYDGTRKKYNDKVKSFEHIH